MPLKPWRTIESRYLIRDPWMNLRADRCELPNGKVIDPYYVQELRDWVQIIAFDDQDRILITRQYRHGAAMICAELPCGTVEPGETAEQAARRELLEETGCVVDTLQPLCSLSPNPARYSNRTHTFIGTNTRRVQQQMLDDTEEIEFEFLTIPEVHALIDSGHFPQALHIASLYLALRSRGLIVDASSSDPESRRP